jgi:Trk K+ transport system NAD-binding subunit
MSAVIADFSTLFLITIFSLLKENKNGLADALIMLSIFILAFLIKVGVKFATKFKWINKTVNMMKHKPHIQMGIRGSFAILFIFLFLAEKLGVEIILGSFIAGILISKISKVESEVLSLKLDAMGYGFFIPFFFIYQGAKSKLPIFSKEGILLFLIILVGSFLIKIVASLPLKLRFSTKETLAGGVLLSGRLSLIIAASIIGMKLGIIDSQMNSAIILLAAFSCVISPALFTIINKKKFSRAPGRIIVVGGGRVGSSIAKRLNEKHKNVVIIEKDENECKHLKNICSAEIYCISGLDIKVWEKIRPTIKDVLLVVTNNDDVNIRVANIVQEKFGVYKIFARDNDPQNRELFKQNGIIPLIYTEALIKTIENAIESPTTFELLHGTSKTISEKTVDRLANKTISQSGIHSVVEVILIKRDDKWLYPSDDFLLKKGDILVFIVDKKEEDGINLIEF